MASIFKMCGKYLIKNKYSVICYGVLCLTSSMFSMISPYISGNFIDYLIVADNISKIYRYCFAFFGLFVFNQLMEKKEKRQKEGMEAKRLRGEWDEVGRPRAIEQEKFNQEFMRVVQKKVTPTQLQRELGLTSSTYYRYRKNFYENFPEFLQSV